MVPLLFPFCPWLGVKPFVVHPNELFLRPPCFEVTPALLQWRLHWRPPPGLLNFDSFDPIQLTRCLRVLLRVQTVGVNIDFCVCRRQVFFVCDTTPAPSDARGGEAEANGKVAKPNMRNERWYQ